MNPKFPEGYAPYVVVLQHAGEDSHRLTLEPHSFRLHRRSLADPAAWNEVVLTSHLVEPLDFAARRIMELEIALKAAVGGLPTAWDLTERCRKVLEQKP